MITVIGSSCLDYTILLPKLPKPGETVVSELPVVSAMGGKGANQAFAARKAGADVCLITKFGMESYTSQLIRNLEDNGIDFSYSSTDPEGHTGCALMLVNRNDGVGYTSCAPGANLQMSKEDVLKGEEAIAKSAVVLLQFEISMEGNLESARLAKKHGCTLVLNPAPFSDFPKELLDLADYVTPNETEASLWTGIEVTDDDSALAAARAIKALNAKRVLITLGKRGCLLYESEDNYFFTDSFEVKAVDSTGAGDAFSGAFARALEKGLTAAEAVRFATAAAGISVTRPGASSSMATEQEIMNFLAEKS